MKKRFVFLGVAFLVAGISVFSRTPATDISGTWQLSVDLENGGHGDPTFVFKQDKETLTGTYSGPLGEHTVTGKVTDKTAVFSFQFENDGETHTATYTATIESPTKMSGTLDISGGPKGKWTGVKK